MAPVKERLRDAGSRLLVAAGVTRVGRALGDRDGSFILYGHRVRDDDEAFFPSLRPHWLREQLAYLTRHHEVIGLDTLVACIVERRPPPPRSVVLTFDDGFRDNVEEALPILDAFGVKATIFVVTGALTEGWLPWSQRLGYLFEHAVASSLRHPLFGDEEVPLADEPSRRRAYAHARRGLAATARGVRDATIQELADAVGAALPRDRMMTWEHAREALANGHGIGAHTYSHALLARVAPEEARWEMERSRVDVEEHLGIANPAFCFPAGSTSPSLRELVRTLGFRSCFLPDPSRRLNRPGDVDAYSLARVGLPNAPGAHLEAEIDGPFHTLRRWAGRYPQRDDR